MIRNLSGSLFVAILASCQLGWTAEPIAVGPVKEVDDVIYGRKSDLALTLDVFTPARQNGVAIVHLANGGWHKAHGEPGNFGELLKRGYTVFRVVIAGEPKFTILEQAADVARAVRFIRFHAQTYHIDPHRIGIEGASSGGHMSLLHAMSGAEGDPQAKDPIDRMPSRVQAAAVFFPLTDLLNYGAPDAVQGGDLGKLTYHRASFDFTEFDPQTRSFVKVHDKARRLELLKQASPITYVTQASPPTLLIHGDKDDVVPLQQSEVLAAKLKAAGVTVKLVVQPDGGHPWPNFWQVDGPKLADWFDEHLKLTSVSLGKQVDTELPSAIPAWPALDWKKAAASPFARVESPAAVVDGKFYLFGGFTEDLQASNQIDVYDPLKDSWTRLKDMPTRLTHLNPAIDGTTIWFAGGFKGKHPGPVVDEVWKYDVASDTWTAGPPLPAPRAGGGLVVVGRTLHYFGGYKSDRDTNAGDHWSLSLEGANTWQREAELPDPRGHVSAAVLDGKIYALGGDHGHDKTQIDVNSCHRFDPATKHWSEIAGLPDGRSHFESSTIIHQGRILIVGGRCNSSQPPRNVVGDLLVYDSMSNKWQVVGSLPEKVLAPAAAIISERLVVIGGGLNNPRPLTANTWIAPVP
ncbi:MAG: hypothetical protein JWM11_7917 [Planctomycetaceae bacterium]|nr:hypothetical protein [Planctomycetaceae bacterium]